MGISRKKECDPYDEFKEQTYELATVKTTGQGKCQLVILLKKESKRNKT
jgi:hypothetical protein